MLPCLQACWLGCVECFFSRESAEAGSPSDSTGKPDDADASAMLSSGGGDEQPVTTQPASPPPFLPPPSPGMMGRYRDFKHNPFAFYPSQ